MKMNKNEITNAGEYSVTEAFEGIDFSEVDRIKILSSLPTFSDQYFITSIELKGGIHGWMYLIANKVYASELVSSMLVVNHPNDVQSLAGDSMAEMINTIAGIFMRDFCRETDYELGYPICDIDSEYRNSIILQQSSLFLSFDFGDNKIYFVVTSG